MTMSTGTEEILLPGKSPATTQEGKDDVDALEVRQEQEASSDAVGSGSDHTLPTNGVTSDAELLTGPPDEAALVAAAAAMAAAAQGHHLFKQEDVSDNLATPDLSSYFLAAAAASVQAQQRRQEDKAQSEDSYDSSATPVPHSVHTNGTSVSGSEEDDSKAFIQEHCRKYTDDRSPFPLDMGKRWAGGFRKWAETASSPDRATEDFDRLPFSEADVGLGKTRCYWALLSADHSQSHGPTGDKLDFVYLDPVLQQHLAEQADNMVGSNFFDYVHPEERDRVQDDMRKIVESRTLFGSVTRCRYSRVPRIREMLGAVDPPRDPEAHKYVEDESFVAIDIVINWIGDGMVLCFFHAIIDKSAEDNEEVHKSDWSNWCGSPAATFTLRQCDQMWKKIKAQPREETPDSGPVHVFQVIEAGGEGKVLLSWPPPRLFPRDTDSSVISLSDTSVFQDGSYFADDFARLAQGVSIAPGSSSLSDANTSCTRRFRAKHTLTTEGKVRSIESVLIPYGGVILACFQTTFQQQLPTPDPQLVAQAKLALQAQADRRRAPEEIQDGPNKRPRLEESRIDDLESKDKPKSALSPMPDASPSLPLTSTLVPEDAKAKSPPEAPEQNPAQSPFNASSASPADPHKSKEATPSLNGHSSPTNLLGGANSLGGSVATLAAVAAAAAAENKSCTGCGKINSPEWRRGPSGHKTLCNACGLRYARSLTRRKKKKGKDGEVEFIEPTGDPSVVPKSRGGGGGSLPGVHRKNSKKRKQEEAAQGASPAAVASAVAAASPAPASASATPSAAVATKANGNLSTNALSPGSSSKGASLYTNSKPTPGPIPKPSNANGKAKSATQSKAPTNAFPNVDPSKAAVVSADPPSAPAASSNIATVSLATSDPHDASVPIAVSAIGAASPKASTGGDALPLPVSTAISQAIAASLAENNKSADVPTSHVKTDSTSNGDASAMSVDNSEADTPLLDQDVSVAALHNMGASMSQELYQQLIQSGLPILPLAPKTGAIRTSDASSQPHVVSDTYTANALTPDALQAAAQAAVARALATGSTLASEPDPSST